MRRETLGREGGEERTRVAELEGRIAGFADTRPCRDPEASPSAAEVHTTFLDRDAVRNGVGRALLRRAMDDPCDREHEVAALWVPTTNVHALGFYEAAGWHTDGASRTDTWRGVELRETRCSVAQPYLVI